MEQPVVAYQPNASWGIPLRDQTFVGTAAEFSRPGTAEMSCWQTACAQRDFAKSWVGGWQAGKGAIQKQREIIFQVQVRFDVTDAFFSA